MLDAAFLVVLASLDRFGDNQMPGGAVGCRVDYGFSARRARCDAFAGANEYTCRVNVFADYDEVPVQASHFHGVSSVPCPGLRPKQERLQVQAIAAGEKTSGIGLN